MTKQTLVHGVVAAGFEAVRACFEQTAMQEEALSAQLAVYHRGRQVVDLWTGPGMAANTLLAVYSSSKGAVHLVMALLVQDRLLDLDAPVTEYWPEFAAAGKGKITVRDLLTHKAGLIGVDGGFTLAELADDARVAARLALQQPYWKPGSASGYHALVMGALAGEIVRRVTGLTLQDVYETRIRSPFGMDFYLGLPESEDIRYLPVQPPEPGANLTDVIAADSLVGIALNLHAPDPTNLYEFPNSRLVRALGNSSAGGIGNAHGLARMYAAVIGLEGAEPLLGPAVLAEFTTPHTPGEDLILGGRDHFLLGFEKLANQYPCLDPTAFGHGGAAGAQSFADPETGIAYSYTRRKFPPGGMGPAPENHRLIEAVIDAAG